MPRLCPWRLFLRRRRDWGKIAPAGIDWISPVLRRRRPGQSQQIKEAPCAMRNNNPNGRMYAARNPGQNAGWGRPGGWGRQSGPGYYQPPVPRQEAPVLPDPEPPTPEVDAGSCCCQPCCPPPPCCIPGPLPPCNRPVPLLGQELGPMAAEQTECSAEVETTVVLEDCQPPLAETAEIAQEAECAESSQEIGRASCRERVSPYV